jgi:hypothetical protein
MRGHLFSKFPIEGRGYNIVRDRCVQLTPVTISNNYNFIPMHIRRRNRMPIHTFSTIFSSFFLHQQVHWKKLLQYSTKLKMLWNTCIWMDAKDRISHFSDVTYTVVVHVCCVDRWCCTECSFLCTLIKLQSRQVTLQHVHHQSTQQPCTTTVYMREIWYLVTFVNEW